MKKRAQMSFSWIFAVIAGAVIIFLAIYGGLRWADTQDELHKTKVAAELNILLDPLETGLATSKAVSIDIKDETRIRLDCNDEDIGYERIRIEMKSPVGDKWQGFGVPSTTHSKYIYSGKIEQGQILNIFSKNFEMPFKIADLIFVSFKNYCFVDAPYFIENEVEDLEIGNIAIVDSRTECEDDSEIVCFSYSSGCDAYVYGLCSGYDCNSDYDFGYVEKDDKKLYYSDALLYGAIFSSYEIYECNFERLMFRLKLLTDLYYGKAESLEKKGCGMGSIQERLLDLGYLASSIDMHQTSDLKSKAEAVEDENTGLCSLY